MDHPGRDGESQPPDRPGGVGNATDAKIDFLVARDASGKGLHPFGFPRSTTPNPPRATPCWAETGNGCPIRRHAPGRGFLGRMLFPSLHPQARTSAWWRPPRGRTSSRPYSRCPWPKPCGARRTDQWRTRPPSRSPTRKGRPVQGDSLRGREGYSLMGAGLWDNPFTIVARAPESEFDAYGPIGPNHYQLLRLNPLCAAGGTGRQAKRAEHSRGDAARHKPASTQR
jgi:hypothetical protein